MNEAGIVRAQLGQLCATKSGAAVVARVVFQGDGTATDAISLFPQDGNHPFSQGLRRQRRHVRVVINTSVLFP